MSRPTTLSQLPDADMQAVDGALLRAAQMARDVARQTGTGIVIVRDGVLVEEPVDNSSQTPTPPLASSRK